ncbi:hypothetical protein HanRHA438_Chr05g0212501 [Helianthus annuus]|uniref:Uncharacterized protein n=1 Tax=Helianthus annuus TaxID=4232 RepID=A0A251UND2_HELAN|nr:hypothetical protein HanRHA438_Chr05g0212501 [Helianthus annuus]
MDQEPYALIPVVSIGAHTRTRVTRMLSSQSRTQRFTVVRSGSDLRPLSVTRRFLFLCDTINRYKMNLLYRD